MMLCSHFYPKDGGDMFPQNTGNWLQNYMASEDHNLQ
jgi:hypothetical protein